MPNSWTRSAAGASLSLSGLAVWAAADETNRDRIDELISGWLPQRAAERYDESQRRLAAEIPEFAIWSGSLDAQATADSLRRLEGRT